MYRGKVTAVDASGVYVQTAEYGTLGPCQAVVANYAVGDMVLCDNVGDEGSPDLIVVGKLTATGSAASIPDGSITSAKIADGTIVNDDISAAAAIDRSKISGLPTSSTDNTLPKFDSTGGALQTSGIVVDDNNRLRVASGSSGGLEIGSSGVLNMSGTGGPSGISAPVGSTWRQTDANTSHGSLTGLLWNKVGTGTAEGTDWLVDFEGRWIDWTPTLTNITRGTGYSQRNRYTRSGKSLTFDFALNFGTSGSVTGGATMTLPVAPANTYEKLFPAMFRTSSQYSAGSLYHSGSTTTASFYIWGTSDTYLGNLAYVSAMPGSWDATGRLSVSGTYEIA